MRRLIFIGALGVLIVGQTVVAQNEDALFDSTTHRGIERVYNLEFEKAEKDFRLLIHMRPGQPAGKFFLAMVLWWRMMIDIDNTEHDEEFLSDLDGVVDMCDSLLAKNPEDVTAMFFKGGAIGFQGRLMFHRNDYIGAANAGRKALPLVQAAAALDPKNYDILLGSGMYDYYADVIPQEYPFLKPLLLFVPPGNKERGIEELTMASRRGKYASIESTYFLLQIYYLYEHDYGKALSLAQELHRRFPRNMLFHRYLGRCNVSLSNWSVAQRIFSEIVVDAQAGMRGYGADAEREAQYYLGVTAMMEGRYEEGLQHFYRCDELSRTLDREGASGFMSMANLKIGMIYDIQGKRDLAISQYRKVLDMKEYKDSRGQAEQYMHSPYTQ
jgi:tetratricopeptide (TPR) repeat protein